MIEIDEAKKKYCPLLGENCKADECILWERGDVAKTGGNCNYCRIE